MIIALTISLIWILANIYIGIYSERKVSAFMQDRLGPMEVGKFGVLQVMADLLKLLQKEDIVPSLADKTLFKFAPWIIFVSIFAGFAVIPFTSDIIGSDTETGVFFLLTIISIDIFGILMAGWASNNKYSLFGAMRSVAQLVSYELPIGISVLTVVVLSQTLSLQQISYQQSIFSGAENYLFSLKFLGINTTDIGGIFTWNIFRIPLLIPVFVIFFIAGLAECNRAPFDMPEAESELIGGFHTEYSGMRFAIMFLSEYGMMLLISLLAAILFFGSWNSPLPNIGSLRLAEWTTGQPGSNLAIFFGLFWLIVKAYFGVFLQMWVRWTYPRLRIDQLMYLSWKVLLPISIALFLMACLYRFLMF
ncbi:MAG: complex I subunit 1 family protein [Bacteroidota bacterium]